MSGCVKKGAVLSCEMSVSPELRQCRLQGPMGCVVVSSPKKADDNDVFNLSGVCERVEEMAWLARVFGEDTNVWQKLHLMSSGSSSINCVQRFNP